MFVVDTIASVPGLGSLFRSVGLRVELFIDGRIPAAKAARRRGAGSRHPAAGVTVSASSQREANVAPRSSS